MVLPCGAGGRKFAAVRVRSAAPLSPMPEPPKPMGRSECPPTEASAGWSQGIGRFHLSKLSY